MIIFDLGTESLHRALNSAAEGGAAFKTVSVSTGGGHDPVARIATDARHCNWHVEAVWKGEAAVTYILLRYVAP